MTNEQRMLELIEAAYREGWETGRQVGFDEDGGAIETDRNVDGDWLKSKARASLKAQSTDTSEGQKI